MSAKVCCGEVEKGGRVSMEETDFLLANQILHQSYLFYELRERILLLCWLMFSWLKYYLFSEQKLNHSVKTLDGARASLKAIKSVEDNQGCM